MSSSSKNICTSYYGQETARFLKQFNIGLPNDQMSLPMIRAYAFLKKAYAIANEKSGMEEEIADAIKRACDDILRGDLNDQFPLSIWQTTSGIQININVNEVISNRAIQILDITGIKIGVHPNDHVNKNQKSCCVFSLVMHIAAVLELNSRLCPALEHFRETLKTKCSEFCAISINGHLSDAIPKNSIEQFDGFIDELSINIERLGNHQERLYQLPMNNSAGTQEIDVPIDFTKSVAQSLEHLTGLLFIHQANKFEELHTCNVMMELSGALNALAVSLMKIIDDICQLGSGRRSSTVERGGSIVSDEANLPQYEAMHMVAAQVMMNHVGLTLGISMANLKSNVFKPLIIKDVLHSIQIISDVCISFNNHLINDITLITHTSTTGQSNTSTSHIEPPLISMIHLVNSITPSPRHNRPKKSRLKKSRSEHLPNLNLPPTQQQQQHPTEEEEIKRLADRLKIFPSPH